MNKYIHNGQFWISILMMDISLYSSLCIFQFWMNNNIYIHGLFSYFIHSLGRIFFTELIVMHYVTLPLSRTHMMLTFLGVLALGCLWCLKCWLCRQLNRFSLCVCDICISLSTHTCGCWRLALSISVMMPLQLIGQLLSERRVSVWCARPLAGHPQIQRSLSCRDGIKQSL